MDWTAVDDSPRLIREELERRGLALKKRWGQNFMINRGARSRIVDLLDVSAGDSVWEIGSGLGGITAILIDRGAEVTVFEIDHGLMQVMNERFGASVRIVAGDAVRSLTTESSAGVVCIVGNLPYRSAAAMILAILESPTTGPDVRRMVFTVQREMAKRMVAAVGSRDYSPFSILCAACADVRLVGDLSPGSFYPAPDVVSSIVTLEPRPIDAQLRTMTSVVARSLFSQRRKTIANNLGILAAQIGANAPELVRVLESESISPDLRAETLNPEQFSRVAARLVTAGYSGRT